MKRIAIFLGELRTEYHFLFLQSLQKQYENEDVSLEAFQNFSIYGSNILFSYGEKNVANIPEITVYDAVIMLPDTFSLSGYEETLLSLFKLIPTVPIISVRKEVEGTYNLLIDDYATMYELIEHYITKHHFTRIAFMKGREDLKDAALRYKAYVDVMEKYHLEVPEYFLFQGNYWTNMREPACDTFLSGDVKPEAIVCANDYMGVSIVEELQKRGYRVPEDIAVSGYDNVAESLSITPTLTTATISYSKISQGIAEMLDNLWNGRPQERNKYIDSQCLYRGSCGCDDVSQISIKHDLHAEKSLLSLVSVQSAFLYLNLDNAKTITEMLYTLPIHLQTIGCTNKIYLCINDKKGERESTSHFTNTMILKGIVDAHGAKLCNEHFNRADILPAKYKNQLSVVVNLHIKDESFGYLVVDGMPGRALTCYLQLFSQGIINWFDRQNIIAQNSELNHIVKEAKYDSLTKIPNRKRLDEALNKAYLNSLKTYKSFFICSIDMDGLKYINDSYGHLAGDTAICTTANIIYTVAKKLGTAARLGGDEFMICYNTSNEERVKENIQKIRDAIEDYNKTHNNPYEISVSIGYSECDQNNLLSNCIEIADAKMYQEKRSKKNARK